MSVYPDGSGLQFVEDLRKVYRRGVVLVLRISLHPEDYRRALELGADAVLSKTAALDDITDAIRQLRLKLTVQCTPKRGCTTIATKGLPSGVLRAGSGLSSVPTVNFRE